MTTTNTTPPIDASAAVPPKPAPVSPPSPSSTWDIPKPITRVTSIPKPSAAFQGVSWFAVALGGVTFAYSTWYAPNIDVNGRYLLIIAFLALLAGVVTVAKVVRDREEGIPTTAMFAGVAWAAALAPFTIVGYWMIFDSTIPVTNRALIAMAGCLCVFGAIAVSKNTRDLECLKR